MHFLAPLALVASLVLGLCTSKVNAQAISDTQRTEIERIIDRKSTRLNSSHIPLSRMPSSA